MGHLVCQLRRTPDRLRPALTLKHALLCCCATLCLWSFFDDEDDSPVALCEELNSYYVAAKLSICDGPVAAACAAANSPKANRAIGVAEAEQKRVTATSPKQAAALTASGVSSKVASAKVANSNGVRGQPAPKPRPASTAYVAAPVIAHAEAAAAVVAQAGKKRKHTTGGGTEQLSGGGGSDERARVRNCPSERSDPCAKKPKSLPSSAPVSAPAAVHADAACTDNKKKKKKNRKKKNLA